MCEVFSATQRSSPLWSGSLSSSPSSQSGWGEVSPSVQRASGTENSRWKEEGNRWLSVLAGRPREGVGAVVGEHTLHLDWMNLFADACIFPYSDFQWEHKRLTHLLEPFMKWMHSVSTHLLIMIHPLLHIFHSFHSQFIPIKVILQTRNLMLMFDISFEFKTWIYWPYTWVLSSISGLCDRGIHLQNQIHNLRGRMAWKMWFWLFFCDWEGLSATCMLSHAFNWITVNRIVVTGNVHSLWSKCYMKKRVDCYTMWLFLMAVNSLCYLLSFHMHMIIRAGSVLNSCAVLQRPTKVEVTRRNAHTSSGI